MSVASHETNAPELPATPVRARAKAGAEPTRAELEAAEPSPEVAKAALAQEEDERDVV